MNYPIWDLPTIGGGSLIALIAILHVYVSHLAVGGGIFIWLTDLKGFRENNPNIHHYLKKHTWFFLLLTMVFGGLTGVGIWFIIALVHPGATSKLIHAFVFGWAIEWVFFIGEILALLIYHYQFDKLGRKNRLTLAFLYALFAWLSLVIINGILSFMLTPGKWLVTQNFWHGFLNPGYLPSLLFRTAVCVMIAGLFGYVTVVSLKTGDFRNKMLKYCSKWLLYPLPFMLLTGVWYYFSLPAADRRVAFALNPQSQLFVTIMFVATVLIFLVGVYFSLKSKPAMQKGLTFVLLIIGLLWMGGFEYTREIARKPFIINHFMYSTGITPAEIEKINQNGILKHAKWTDIKEISVDNQIPAGKRIYQLQCGSCHTINGIRNDVVKRSQNFTYTGLLAQLTGQGKILSYMPPFVGTSDEKEALAAYIHVELLGKELSQEQRFTIPLDKTPTIPPFDGKKDQYVLLVWNDLGMHCMSDVDSRLVILPPANTLEAHLIRRGLTPTIITENVELSYQVEAGFENPSQHVSFWDYAPATFGVTLEKNIGLSGNGLGGKFVLKTDANSFIADKIPVTPYNDAGEYNPYPLFTVQAKDSQSGELLITTAVVAPVSTEMGCKNCHGGGWRRNGATGMTEETADNILLAHDRLSGTNLYKTAKNGQPRLCQSCHADPALAAEGKPENLNFSAAMHGFHANYMPVEGAKACQLCHPASPMGSTQCARGIHSKVQVTCINCHGTMQEHALSLLKGQADKKNAAPLMQHLAVQHINSQEEAHPRIPWLQEPDCLTCHVEFQKPAADATGYNVWNASPEELYRNRSDNAMIRCEACHGSPHAEYPASNPYGINRDNIQPMQYAGQPFPIGANQTCQVCHIQKMEDAIHHENMNRMMRNVNL